jgi:hypothetical protein
MTLPIYALDSEKGFWPSCVDYYWIAVMFIGYPFFLMIEWIYWEIKGEGPKKFNHKSF